MCSSSPARTPKSTSSCTTIDRRMLDPTKKKKKKKKSHIHGQRRSPNKMAGGEQSCLESNLISTRDAQRHFTSTTRHTHNWVVFLLWLSLFIPSGAISPLFSSCILGTCRPREFIFQCHIFFLFCKLASPKIITFVYTSQTL